MERSRIVLSTENRALAYGGALDLVMGTNYLRVIDDLKFSALFYEHVIVPDGFFHCFGPLHSWAACLQRKEPYDRKQSDLTRLLHAKVFVPAIRQGESLADNWLSGAHGVVPGLFLNIPRTEENERILRYFDEETRVYANWPSGMGTSKTHFGALLKKFFAESDSPFRKDQLRPLDLMDGVTRGAYDAMFDGILQRIADHAEDPRIRRGQFEEVVSQHLGMQLTSYQQFIDRADFYNPQDLAAAGLELMATISTVYEIYQARQFGAVATLFPLHRSRVIEAGVYNYLIDLPKLERDVVQTPLLAGSFDVSQLAIADILTIRDSDQFADYIGCLKAIAPVPIGKTFLEVNAPFVDCLISRYLPFVSEHYPSVGRIERVQKIVSVNTGVAALYVASSYADSLFVGWHPLLLFVLGATSLATQRWPTTISDRYDEYVSNRRVRQLFNNNYTTWTTPSVPGSDHSLPDDNAMGMPPFDITL